VLFLQVSSSTAAPVVDYAARALSPATGFMGAVYNGALPADFGRGLSAAELAALQRRMAALAAQIGVVVELRREEERRAAVGGGGSGSGSGGGAAARALLPLTPLTPPRPAGDSPSPDEKGASPDPVEAQP